MKCEHNSVFVQRLRIDGSCRECYEENLGDLRAKVAELEAELHERTKMLIDAYFATRREGWEQGETEDEVLERLHLMLCEILGDPFPNLDTGDAYGDAIERLGLSKRGEE